jgi:hypothetical protein
LAVASTVREVGKEFDLLDIGEVGNDFEDTIEARSKVQAASAGGLRGGASD